MDSTQLLSNIGRWLMAIASAIYTIIDPALPYLLLCTGFVFLDCWSAYRLARRVSRVHPEKASGKLRSEKLRHIFLTLAEVYAVVLLVYYAQVHIAAGLPVSISKIVVGAVCGWQFWSYLENSASCNGAQWARTAQQILVDKTERHFDIKIPELHTPTSNAQD